MPIEENEDSKVTELKEELLKMLKKLEHDITNRQISFNSFVKYYKLLTTISELNVLNDEHEQMKFVSFALALLKVDVTNLEDDQEYTLKAYKERVNDIVTYYVRKSLEGKELLIINKFEELCNRVDSVELSIAEYHAFCLCFTKAKMAKLENFDFLKYAKVLERVKVKNPENKTEEHQLSDDQEATANYVVFYEELAGNVAR